MEENNYESGCQGLVYRIEEFIKYKAQVNGLLPLNKYVLILNKCIHHFRGTIQ